MSEESDDLKTLATALLGRGEANNREIIAAAALITLGMVELAKATDRGRQESLERELAMQQLMSEIRDGLEILAKAIAARAEPIG